MLVEKVATLRIAQNHATLQARQQQQLQQYTEDLKRIDARLLKRRRIFKSSQKMNNSC
ncbi:hypothetical protein AAHB43_10025 [Staphylococcus pseudintermedius]